jgi:hypothetical protein
MTMAPGCRIGKAETDTTEFWHYATVHFSQFLQQYPALTEKQTKKRPSNWRAEVGIRDTSVDLDGCSV